MNCTNMNESFPRPLSEKEEKEALKNLSSPSVKSMFIERNLRLASYIAHRFMDTGIDMEDLIAAGTIGLIKAVNTFDIDRNIKFSSYASRCIKNEILMYLRKNPNMRDEVSIDEPVRIDGDGHELSLSDILGTEDDIVSRNIEDEAEKNFLYTAIQKLPEREQCIINLRYGIGTSEEKTQKEAADMLGISQSYISRLEKGIIEKLRNEFKKNDMM